MGEGAKIFRLAGTVKYSSSHGGALPAVGVSHRHNSGVAWRWSGLSSQQQWRGGATPVLPLILQYEKGTGNPVPFAVVVEPRSDVEPRRVH